MGHTTARIKDHPTSPALMLLLLLLAADSAFILLHVVYVETRWVRGAFSLEADGGVPEIFQYLKQFWIVLCMGAVCIQTRRKVYACWAAVFAFLMIDDAIQIHEQVGYWLGQQFAMPTWFGLRPDDFGEMTFAAAVGLFVLALAIPALHRDDHSRRVARNMLILMLMLGVAGVVVDALHVIAYFRGSLLAQFLLIAEDGGEMLVMSALLAYSFDVTRSRGRSRLDLWKFYARWKPPLTAAPAGYSADSIRHTTPSELSVKT